MTGKTNLAGRQRPGIVIDSAGAVKFNIACLLAGAEGTENGKPMRAGFVKCTGVGAGKSVGNGNALL